MASSNTEAQHDPAVDTPDKGDHHPKIRSWYRKKRYWFLLCILSTLLALYFASPYLAQQALAYWLKQQAFSETQLAMQPPRWNRIEIDNLHLKKEEAGFSYSIDTGPITIEFHPWKLYLNQRLDLIRVPQSKVQIDFKTATTEAEKPATETDLLPLLPSSWFDKIPVDLIQMGELNLALNYPDAANWQLSGSLLFDGNALNSRVKFFREQQDLGWSDLNLNADNLIKLSFLLQDKPVFEIDGLLHYALNNGTNSSNRLHLYSKQTLHIAKLQQWLQQMQPEQPLPEVTQGNLELAGDSYFPLNSRFTPDDLIRSIQTQQEFKLALTLGEQPLWKQFKLDTHGTFSFENQQFNATLDKDSQLQLQQLELPEIKTGKQPFTLNLRKPLSLTWQAPTEFELITQALQQGNLKQVMLAQAQISPFSLKLVTPSLHRQSMTLQPLNLLLNITKIDLNTPSVSGHLSIPNLQVKDKTLPLTPPTLSLENRFHLKADTLSNHFKLRSGTPEIEINGSSHSNINNLNSRFNWELKPVGVKKVEQLLSELKLPPELQINRGTLFHKGSGRLRNGKLNLAVDNSLRSTDLIWEKIQLNNLQLDSHTTLSPNGKLRDKGSIKLAEVITGVKITKVETSYDYQRSNGRDLLQLEAMQAHLLGGKVNIEDFRFNPLQPDINTHVEIDRLDLGAILALEQQRGLSGEGILSGRFPLQYSQGELTVSDGKLEGLAPGGVIRFQPNASVAAYAAANAGLQMALQALENFHYDLLDIKLNYLADGTALLNTRLKGKNPDWNRGHPVDFTINIEENIPKLMQTLQFADKLTESIEKGYR